MKKTLAKIFFVIAIGLLFTHQFVSHHHNDDDVAFSHHHSDHDDDDDGLPAHSLDHSFSNHNYAANITKVSPQEIVLLSWLSFQIQKPEPLSSTYHYVDDIKPPVSDYFSISSRRGPPAC